MTKNLRTAATLPSTNLHQRVALAHVNITVVLRRCKGEGARAHAIAVRVGQLWIRHYSQSVRACALLRVRNGDILV